MREHAVLATDHEHDRKLEPLGIVQRHQRDDALVVAQVVLLGEERDLLEELLHRAAVLRRGVVLARHSDELLEVLEAPLGLDRPLRPQSLQVPDLAVPRRS